MTEEKMEAQRRVRWQRIPMTEPTQGVKGGVDPSWVGMARMGEMGQSTGASQGHSPLWVGRDERNYRERQGWRGGGLGSGLG